MLVYDMRSLPIQALNHMARCLGLRIILFPHFPFYIDDVIPAYPYQMTAELT